MGSCRICHSTGKVANNLSAQHAPLITVLTPTYNRSHTLPRLAESLRAQGYADYEWLVVDDGSTDDTEACLEGLAREGSLPLRVIRMENGGKHRAVNRAVPEVRGAWTFIVDSDDILPEGALARIARLAGECEGDGALCGIMGLKGDFEGHVVGGLLPEGTGPIDTASLTFTWKIRGDKAEVFRTEVLARYPFPEIEGEKFITECSAWYRMARDGLRFRLSNELLYLCEYRDDGLSARSLELRIRNPEGTLLFYSEELNLEFPWWKLLREAANLVRFSVHAGRLHQTISGLSPRGRFLAVVSMPLGLLAAARDAVQLRRRGK